MNLPSWLKYFNNQNLKLIIRFHSVPHKVTSNKKTAYWSLNTFLTYQVFIHSTVVTSWNNKINYFNMATTVYIKQIQRTCRSRMVECIIVLFCKLVQSRKSSVWCFACWMTYRCSRNGFWHTSTRQYTTIPLEGDLAHKDSMGNTEIIRNGDVQVMSWNWSKAQWIQSKTKTNELNCWFGFSNQKNVEPCYQQITLDPEERNNNYNKFFHQMQRMREFGFIKTPGFKIWQRVTTTYSLKRRQWCLCYPFREGNDWWSRIRDQRWLGIWMSML
jgi:hypothetical protein